MAQAGDNLEEDVFHDFDREEAVLTAQAAREPESEPEDVKQELRQNEDWRAVLFRKQCYQCHNLDPRAHPQTTVSRLANGRLLSQLEPLICSVSATRVIWRTEKCGFCDLLFRAVHQVLDKDPIHGQAWLELDRITLVEDQPVLLTVFSAAGRGAASHIGIEVFKLPQSGNIPELDTVGSLVPVAPDAGSEQCFEFIRRCLKSCQNGHPECHQNSPAMPKRVLALDGPGSTPTVRLHHSSKSDRHRYVALSHCWGPDKTAKKRLKLTRDTMAAFESLVPWDDLPETFQDGILVAWRLGVRFVWIDSLCIIQGDAQDWEVEAAKMGDYYRNAYLTVAASSSPCGDVGFLTPRPDSVLHPEEIKYFGPRAVHLLSKLSRSVRSGKANLYARRSSRVSHNMAGGQAGWSRFTTLSSGGTIPGPLSTRAWTMQERMLSTRIVHFTEEGVIWECAMMTLSEDQRPHEPGPLSQWRSFIPINGLLEQRRQKMARRLHATWRYLVVDYSSRSLTHRDDVLPAISSLAARMHFFLCTPYLAGLWYSTFIQDLCWRPSVARNRNVPLLPPLPATSHGIPPPPTWSWMSLAHAVSYSVLDTPGRFISHCVLSSKVTDTDSQFLRPPADPRMTLRGRLVEANMTFNGHRSYSDATSAYVYSNGDHSYSNVLLYDALLVPAEAISPLSGEKVQTARRGREGEAVDFFQGVVYLLDLGRWEPLQKELAGLEKHHILVLAPSVDYLGAYERVGMADESLIYSETVRREVWGAVTVGDVVLV